MTQESSHRAISMTAGCNWVTAARGNRQGVTHVPPHRDGFATRLVLSPPHMADDSLSADVAALKLTSDASEDHAVVSTDGGAIQTLSLPVPPNEEDLHSTVQTALDTVQERHTKKRIRPTVILNAVDLAQPTSDRIGLLKGDVCTMGKLVCMERLAAKFERIPPGTRTSHPHAHRLENELVFCVSGGGVVWQNGFTYPFGPGDVASWKAGTGVVHTIINDSNRDDPAQGEDLLLISVSEDRPDESLYYPLSPERRAAISEAQTWKEEAVPHQNEFGPHPGYPCIMNSKDGRSGVSSDHPRPSDGPRPSNIANAFEAAEGVGQGDMFAHGCSLTAESGLRGATFGCNLEILPPGTRSSFPHAHSEEEEFIFVLEGSGSLWLNGDTVPVGPGDCVGFPRGTGIAHNFINDSNVGGVDGEDLALLILGESKPSVDKVVYPVNPERQATFARWWHDSPKHKLGSHNGCPKMPRK
ncbi:hypothetical protein BKA62DRAFT_286804 [Auriculariales sp. MPI-PUGE-AT-0066]|nr:hypothetical protein BKA62DRAFT_286804 [Auriculariales sp. MPI-PUGE-AT-0066]